MMVFIINGHGGVGKDTFVEYFTEFAGEKYVLNISTVDYVKDVARSLGWSGKKDNLSRKFLSDLKDMTTYWADKPFRDVINRTRIAYDEWSGYGVDSRCFVFIHCREPKEIQRLVDEMPFPTYSLLIRRRGLQNYGNHADDEVENFKYDFVIENNYGLDNLKSEAINFYNKVK